MYNQITSSILYSHPRSKELGYYSSLLNLRIKSRVRKLWALANSARALIHSGNQQFNLSPRAIKTHQIGVSRSAPITSSPSWPIASVKTRSLDQIASASRGLVDYGPDTLSVGFFARGSQLVQLVTFYLILRTGGFVLNPARGAVTLRYSVITVRGTCPTRHHPRTENSGLTSSLTSLTSLLTSSRSGIVTLPLIADSGWLKLKFRLIFKITSLYQIQMAIDL